MKFNAIAESNEDINKSISNKELAQKPFSYAINVPIPKGFPARMIMPNGTFMNATHVRLVPGGNGVKTAYPLIPGL